MNKPSIALLGYVVGVGFGLLLTAHAQELPELSLDVFNSKGEQVVFKRHENKRIEALIATSTLEAKDAEQIVHSEDNTKQITKRLDRIIQILETK